MRAMVLQKQRQPLQLIDLPIPQPGPTQVQIQIRACAVCRTDLHVVDGELTQPRLPLIPGHEIVGHVSAMGSEVTKFKIADRVAVPCPGSPPAPCHSSNSLLTNLST